MTTTNSKNYLGDYVKIKDFDRLRHALYLEAIKCTEIAETLRATGQAYIYDLNDGKKHAILPVQYPSQINRAIMEERGFDPETADVTLVFKLNRSTQCVEFNAPAVKLLNRGVGKIEVID